MTRKEFYKVHKVDPFDLTWRVMEGFTGTVFCHTYLGPYRITCVDGDFELSRDNSVVKWCVDLSKFCAEECKTVSVE